MTNQASLKNYQKVGAVLGPLVFVIMLFADAWQDTMPSAAWRTAAVGL
ncbi:MAG: hypothetical protein HKN70_04095, partial [Gammaproteobacteria bacterium]|nr:hypothetical protein [Gammaproteobacteria bacterium]